MIPASFQTQRPVYDDLIRDAKAAERQARALKMRSAGFKFAAAITLTCALGLGLVAGFAATGTSVGFAAVSAGILGVASAISGLISHSSHQAASLAYDEFKDKYAQATEAADQAMQNAIPLVGKDMANTVITSKKRNAEQMWVQKVAIGAKIPQQQLEQFWGQNRA